MPEQQNYSLSDLMNELQMVIRSSFDHTYWVVAELANVSGSARGHMYMELVEKSNHQIIAKARANLWSSRRQQIMRAFEEVTKETVKAGMKVLLQLSFDFHPVYGLSFQVLDIDPSYSLGEMERQKQETIKRLEEEGLLDFNKQYVLPVAIQRLAVISSESAAGYQDFMNQLEQNTNNYRFDVQIFPAVMQGDKAPGSIISALEKLENIRIEFDALIIIRGGGSNLDLACFDDYSLNARLAQSYFPIFSGIGHERDQSVTDMIAHTRLKTPTAVAEHIVQHNIEFENKMKNLFSFVVESAQNEIAENHYQLERGSSRMAKASMELIHSQQSEIRELSYSTNQSTLELIHQNKSQIQQMKNDVLYLSKSLIKEQEQFVNHQKQQVKLLSKDLLNRENSDLYPFKQLVLYSSLLIDKESNKLDYIKQLIKVTDPENLLKRGFSITRQNGKAITNPILLEEGTEIETQLAEGSIKSKIIK